MMSQSSTKPDIAVLGRADGQARRLPRRKPADDIGDVAGTKVEKGTDGQTRRIALSAQQDQRGVHAADRWMGGPSGWVDPPLQHGAVDRYRSGDDAVPASLRVGAGVDEQRAGLHGGERLSGFEPAEARPGTRQQLVDRLPPPGHGPPP